MGKCGQCGVFFKRLDSHQRTSAECGDPTGTDEEESSVEESFVCDDLEAMQEVNVGREEIFTESDGYTDRPNQHETIGNAIPEEGQSDSDSDDDPENRNSIPKALVVLDKLEESAMVPNLHPTLSQMKPDAKNTAKRKTNAGTAKKETPVKAACSVPRKVAAAKK